jgi:hypothetical protein
MCAWLCKVMVGAAVGAIVVGAVACAIAEPCGAIALGGGLALAGGEMLAGGLAITVSSTVVTAAAGGAAVGAAAGGGYAYNESHGNSSSGSSSTSAAETSEEECAENASQPNAGSLKTLKDKQAKNALKQFDTEPHAFKEEFVGRNDVAKFDIATGDDHQLYLLSKNGKVQIPTGYFVR